MNFFIIFEICMRVLMPGEYSMEVQLNLSIAVTIGAKFLGCYRQVAALMS